MAGIPQIKIVFDRRKKASAVNPGTVEIEVSYNRERVRLSTGVAITVLFWIVDFLVEPFVTLLSALFEGGSDAREKFVCVGVAPIVHYACYLFTPVRGIELFVLFSADGG